MTKLYITSGLITFNVLMDPKPKAKKKPVAKKPANGSKGPKALSDMFKEVA